MIANLLTSPLREPDWLGHQEEAARKVTETAGEVRWCVRRLGLLLVLLSLVSALPTTLASYEEQSQEKCEELMETDGPPIEQTQEKYEEFMDTDDPSITTYQPTPEIVTLASCPDPEMSPEEAQTRLWEAVERDDGLGVEEAVLCGADTGERRGDDMTPMTQAARGGAEAAVGALVRLGADPERAEGKLGRTPLHYAAKHGREAVVQELLAAGASPGPQSKARSTPLHLAAWYGHLDVARLLVGAGAEVNIRTTEGHTPLALAVMRGQPELEAYLRSVGGQE